MGEEGHPQGALPSHPTAPVPTKIGAGSLQFIGKHLVELFLKAFGAEAMHWYPCENDPFPTLLHMWSALPGAERHQPHCRGG